MGEPKKRPRVIAWGTESETTDFHGSADELLELVSQSLEVNGSIYFIMEEQRKDEVLTMARNQKNFVSREDVLSAPMDYLTKPATLRTFHAHMRERGAIAARVELFSVTGCGL